MLLDDVRRTASGMASRPPRPAPMRIVHCLRAPVGGLFRHVCDLAVAQHKAGHKVGIICDSSTGGAFDEENITRVTPLLALGLERFAMPREISPSDLPLMWRLTGAVRNLNPNILHTHGSKGGAYGRTVGTLLRASGLRVARIYSPHGGSLHYDAATMRGRVYFTLERALALMTDAFIFVCQFEADAFTSKVGKPKQPTAIALNGLRPEEFEPIAEVPDARDFLFVGTLRDLKGPDVFLQALAAMRSRNGTAPTAVVVGDGPDKPRYQAMAAELGLADAVAFRDPMPAQAAFRLAHVMVMPSRNESMPYIALEAIAAGMPIVATRVGGVPEIFGPDADSLVPPGDASALADAMIVARMAPENARQTAARLKERVRGLFNVEAMAATVDGVYRQVIAR